MTEKRKHQRVALGSTVRCFVDQELVAEGLGRDLSLGGVFVECAVPLGFGQKLQVDLTIENVQLRLPAVVRWSTEEGMGLQFGLLGARETHAILRLLKKSAS